MKTKPTYHYVFPDGSTKVCGRGKPPKNGVRTLITVLEPVPAKTIIPENVSLAREEDCRRQDLGLESETSAETAPEDMRDRDDKEPIQEGEIVTYIMEAGKGMRRVS